MTKQPGPVSNQAQGNEEVTQVTGEQGRQLQTTGVPAPGADIRSSNNDPTHGNDNEDHKEDGFSNPLYELLLNAKDDQDAMRKLIARWDQLKGMVNTPYPGAENKTALRLAAEKGFIEVIRKWGHTEVAEFLLSYGAHPKATIKGVTVVGICGFL